MFNFVICLLVTEIYSLMKVFLDILNFGGWDFIFNIILFTYFFFTEEHSASQITVTPHSLLVDEGSTVLPVFVTSEFPELKRVPKNAQSGGAPPSVQDNEIEPR